MTLHWWMHWFWITAFALNTVWASALPPESSDKYNIGTKEYSKYDQTAVTEPNIEDASHERVGKSVGFTRKSTLTPAVFTKPQTFVNPYPQSSDITDVGEEIVQRELPSLSNSSNLNNINITKDVENIPNTNFNDSLKNHADNTKPSIKSDNRSISEFSNNSSIEKSTVREILITYSNNETSVHAEVRSTKGPFDNVTVSSANDTVTVDEIKDGNITEKPLTLETTINEQHILSSLHVVEPTKGKITLAAASIEDQSSYGSLDTAAVAGISFAALVLLALTGATSFVLYRRRYLNKPQTLNDKCSNADSSGYIDDSTIRENSEEMYSLDNDSFLNSLEAMTIQNYWTDTVKHTKL